MLLALWMVRAALPLPVTVLLAKVNGTYTKLGSLSSTEIARFWTGCGPCGPVGSSLGCTAQPPTLAPPGPGEAQVG